MAQDAGEQGQEFVIAGYTPSPRNFDALIFGYHEGDRLLYVARTRNGFTSASREQLYRRFAGLEIATCPFVNLPEAREGRWGQGLTAEKIKDCRWLKPALVGQFEYLEWTSDGHLRHSGFVALRSDKKRTRRAAGAFMLSVSVRRRGRYNGLAEALPVRPSLQSARRWEPPNTGVPPRMIYASRELIDFADVTRLSRSGDFIRWQRSSKFGRAPFQRRSSTVSKTGTSSRKVARVRNNRASFHALTSDSDTWWAFRIEGCHSRQSFGMSSRWGYSECLQGGGTEIR